MNAFRLGFLLLLALALPWRAALGAMPPLLGADPIETVAMADDDAAEPDSAELDSAACEHTGALHAHDAGRTACQACDACCSAAAPPAALPAVVAPAAVGVVVFATPPTRAASFLGDAPRRPPRRC